MSTFAPTNLTNRPGSAAQQCIDDKKRDAKSLCATQIRTRNGAQVRLQWWCVECVYQERCKHDSMQHFPAQKPSRTAPAWTTKSATRNPSVPRRFAPETEHKCLQWWCLECVSQARHKHAKRESGWHGKMHHFPAQKPLRTAPAAPPKRASTTKSATRNPSVPRRFASEAKRKCACNGGASNACIRRATDMQNAV